MNKQNALFITGILLVISVVVVGIFITDRVDSHTGNAHEGAMNTVDTSKEIEISNHHDQSVTINVKVTRESTDKVVHNQSYTLDSGESLDEVYNVAQSNPDGIEEFTVTAMYDNQTESVTIKTNQCYGGVIIEITGNNNLYSYYPIC